MIWIIMYVPLPNLLNCKLLTFANFQRSTGTKLTGSINKTGGTISTYCGLTVVLMGTLLLLAVSNIKFTSRHIITVIQMHLRLHLNYKCYTFLEARFTLEREHCINKMLSVSQACLFCYQSVWFTWVFSTDLHKRNSATYKLFPIYMHNQA